MKFWQYLPSKRHKLVFAAIIFILIIYFLLQIFFLETDILFTLKSYLSESYLFLIEKLANFIFSFTGSTAYFDNSQLLSDNNLVVRFSPHIRYEKLTALLILFIFLTRAPIKDKLLFTLIFIITHYVFNSLYIAAGAHLAAIQSPYNYLLTITITFWLLASVSLFLIWYRKHKLVILSGISKFKINISLLENERRLILYIIIFILLISLLTEAFEYKLWIRFLFTSAQNILSFLGYEATVDNSRLIGPNGIISMSKSCLGFQMMLLFTAMIILTGNKNRFRWIYIISGIIFLNFINILRFVLLFIHLDKHANYLLSIEAHNMYNYFTYVIVFLLWIIWFEKFADFKTNKEINIFPNDLHN